MDQLSTTPQHADMAAAYVELLRDRHDWTELQHDLATQARLMPSCQGYCHHQLQIRSKLCPPCCSCSMCSMQQGDRDSARQQGKTCRISGNGWTQLCSSWRLNRPGWPQSLLKTCSRQGSGKPLYQPRSRCWKVCHNDARLSSGLCCSAWHSGQAAGGTRLSMMPLER